MANESGSDNGNEITLEQLLMNLANSGNEKHVKLASDLLDLNLVQENISDKRVRSNSNDSEKINLEVTVSPNKKQKSTRHKKIDVEITGNGNTNNSRKQGQDHLDQKKSGFRNRDALNKDLVLVAITEIPENTYFNSIKMEYYDF